jgi:hypothetical protein
LALKIHTPVRPGSFLIAGSLPDSAQREIVAIETPRISEASAALMISSSEFVTRRLSHK